MNTLNSFILLCITTVFCGCWGPAEYPDYPFSKTPNTTDKLRLDGYYYAYDNISTNINVHVLYRDGVVLFCSTGKNFAFFEEKFKTGKFGKSINISSWGMYLIEDDSITTSCISKVPGYFNYMTYISKGIILNDTTFKMIRSNRSDGEVFERKEVFHFKQFDFKPDSTNNFIK